MSQDKSVFIVGPGYIGRNILELLAKEGYRVDGLVRSEERAKELELSGGHGVLGDLNDSKAITEETSKHDIIIHAASADHIESVVAVLEGIRRRVAAGKKTIFIHTSGTSVLDDRSISAYKQERVYSDKDRSGVDSVPDDAPHRSIDLAVLKAQKEFGENAKIVIIIPPLIYGINKEHKRLTIQIPTLTRFAIKVTFSYDSRHLRMLL